MYRLFIIPSRRTQALPGKGLTYSSCPPPLPRAVTGVAVSSEFKHQPFTLAYSARISFPHKPFLHSRVNFLCFVLSEDHAVFVFVLFLSPEHIAFNHLTEQLFVSTSMARLVRKCHENRIECPSRPWMSVNLLTNECSTRAPVARSGVEVTYVEAQALHEQAG